MFFQVGISPWGWLFANKKNEIGSNARLLTKHTFNEIITSSFTHSCKWFPQGTIARGEAQLQTTEGVGMNLAIEDPNETGWNSLWRTHHSGVTNGGWESLRNVAYIDERVNWIQLR